jgi:hypothetical protein
MGKFIEQIADNKNLLKHLRTALFIGFMVNIINQGGRLIHLDFDSIDFFKFILTFIVPFGVSVYSAATIRGTIK